MKYCYECGRLTAGEPLFCGSCGRSYDVKLCPRLHANPRSAEVCSQCGSRELSTPQPRVPLWWKVFAFLLNVWLGLVLACLTLLAVVGLLEGPEGHKAVLSLFILFGILWWIWSELPHWLQNLIRRLMKRKERRDER